MAEPGRRLLGDRYELAPAARRRRHGPGLARHATSLLHRAGRGQGAPQRVHRRPDASSPGSGPRRSTPRSLSHPQHRRACSTTARTIAQDGTGETLAYLVMELVEGEPLADAASPARAALGAATTLVLLRQTAFGARRGARGRPGAPRRQAREHPRRAPDGSVKITDFGIAWSAAQRRR